MMPVHLDAPWLPKFDGLDSELKYGEWKKQLQGLTEYAGATERQKLAF